MLHSLLADTRFFEFLLLIDQDIAAKCQAASCPHCGGILDAGHFGRKPRGHLPALPIGFDRRFSFCCRIDGCRRRQTPASIRFLGRRVYLLVTVTVAMVMMHGATPSRVRELRKHMGADWRTVANWRYYFSELFPQSRRGRELIASFCIQSRGVGLLSMLWQQLMAKVISISDQAMMLARFLIVLTRNVTATEGNLINRLAVMLFPQKSPNANE